MAETGRINTASGGTGGQAIGCFMDQPHRDNGQFGFRASERPACNEEQSLTDIAITVTGVDNEFIGQWRNAIVLSTRRTTSDASIIRYIIIII